MCLIGPKILFDLKNHTEHNSLIIKYLLFNWNSETQNALFDSDTDNRCNSLIIKEFLFN